MAIGVAMLGVGASGTLVATLGAPRATRGEAWFAWAAILTAVSLVASPALVHVVPLDATRLAWDAGPWAALALVYVLLAVPFGLGALATLLALTIEPERSGRLYGASFAGAGLGAALAVAVLWVASPGRALAVPAVVAVVGAVVAAGNGKGETGSVRLGSHVSRVPFLVSRWLPWLVVASTLLALVHPPWRLTITPYKGLPQVEAYPNARRVAEATSPVGWVVAVDAPAFRFAPGLSLGYSGPFPRQTALFVDGELAGAATWWDETPGAGDLLDWLPTALPYAAGAPAEVLVVGAGGGLEVANALQHGAGRVTAVELSADLVHLARATHVAADSGAAARVRWVVGDARGYLERTSARFDLITIGPGGAPGAAAGGVHALDQNFLHTVDAYTAYLGRLSDEGVLAVTRWLTVPPREPVRVILTAAAALRRGRPAALGRGLVVARSWGTATVLAKPAGFDDAEISALRRWATARGFDLDWYPGGTGPGATFHVLDQPTLFEAARAAVTSPAAAAAFAAAYPFDVAPVDDRRPYPQHFLRPTALGAFLAAGRGSWLPFAEWGYVALLATLAQSLVLGGLLLLLPLVRRGRAPPSRLVIAYFACLGLGYLAAEIAVIQQLELLLGHPVYAVAAALAAFLVCSGAGAWWSDRLNAARSRPVAVTTVVLLGIGAVSLLAVVQALQGAPLAVRVAVAAVVLAPLATLMGMPFPLGLRALKSGEPAPVAWVWAANGFASVVAAPLAALVALEAGSPVLLLGAAACYGGAAGLAGWGRRLTT